MVGTTAWSAHPRAILKSEESHIDFLETQFELIERIGLQNYVQMQSTPAEE